MKKPFLNSDQILNQVFDQEKKILKTSSTGNAPTPAREEFPVAAYRDVSGNIKDLYILAGGILKRSRVDRSRLNE